MITADQAQKLLDEATDGPWVENSEEDRDEGACGDITANYLESTNGGKTYTVPVVVDELRWNKEGDGRLIAAAPDLAQTVVDQAKQIAAVLAKLDDWDERSASAEEAYGRAQVVSISFVTSEVRRVLGGDGMTLTPVDRYAALRSLEFGLSAAIARAAEDVRAFRTLTRGKSFTSDHGEVEFRRNDPKVKVNPAALLAWAEENRPEAVEPEHTVTVPAALKPWLVKEMEARLQIVESNGTAKVVDVTTGELVDFAAVEPGRPDTVAFRQSSDQKAAAVELVADRVEALTSALAPEVTA